MIDITKIQLNPIPPSIMELQTSNKILVGKNSFLTDILIVTGSLVLLIVGDMILADMNVKNEKETKNKNSRVLTNSK